MKITTLYRGLLKLGAIVWFIETEKHRRKSPLRTGTYEGIDDGKFKVYTGIRTRLLDAIFLSEADAWEEIDRINNHESAKKANLDCAIRELKNKIIIMTGTLEGQKIELRRLMKMKKARLT